MNTQKKLHIGMSLAPTWLSGEAWRRPDSDVEGLLGSDFYVDIAKRAEAAHVDFVFRPDTLFLTVEALERGPGFTSLDPTVLLASVARETSRIGLLSTVSTTFFPPYVVARQIQSLNWLSNGRAGWNIVTALEGHGNFGLSEMPSAEERYERAAEFTEIVRSLWASYPEQALRFDRAEGHYADSSLVRPINYAGRYLSVAGPLNLPALSRAPIPLVQAGASPAGRHFAASVADAIFASTPDKEAAQELRRDLRRRAVDSGREANDVLLLPGLSLYLAESRAAARELFSETHSRLEKGRKLAAIRSMIGLDLTGWPMDRPVTSADLPALPERPRSHTHTALLYRLVERLSPTVEQLLERPEVIGSAHWRVIGTVEDAFEAIHDWAGSGAMDGFVAVPGGSVASMRLVLEELLPCLSEAGLFRKMYSADTFMGHLKE